MFQQVFDLVDRYDLYGQVAYPKQHLRAQIPAIYRCADPAARPVCEPDAHRTVRAHPAGGRDVRHADGGHR
jgi:hypothetical protein